MRLLRVLQFKEFERVGGVQTIRTDARVIAATHRDLAEIGLNAAPALEEAAMERLQACGWPGTVRELENAVERALILSRGRPLSFDELGTPETQTRTQQEQPNLKPIATLDEAVARHIRQALTVAAGKVAGKDGAARLLGVNPGTLRNRMKKLRIPYGRKTANSP